MKQQIIERFPGISCAWMDAGRKAEAECYSVDYMDVVFRYKYGGVGFGCKGMPGGTSIAVYSNGDVVKCEYDFGDNEPIERIVLAKLPELAKSVAEIIARSGKLACWACAVEANMSDFQREERAIGGNRGSFLRRFTFWHSLCSSRNPHLFRFDGPFIHFLWSVIGRNDLHQRLSYNPIAMTLQCLPQQFQLFFDLCPGQRLIPFHKDHIVIFPETALPGSLRQILCMLSDR